VFIINYSCICLFIPLIALINLLEHKRPANYNAAMFELLFFPQAMPQNSKPFLLAFEKSGYLTALLLAADLPCLIFSV